MSKVIHREIDLGNLPVLTAKQRAELKALSNAADTEINYDDQPQLSRAFLKDAVRNPLYKPTKTPTTVRMDSDVLAWLKAQGKGYQTRMNAILRQEMLRDLLHQS
ncbi:MAG: BrnA antitoxin family protein [Comamonas sp.]